MIQEIPDFERRTWESRELAKDFAYRCFNIPVASQNAVGGG